LLSSDCFRLRDAGAAWFCSNFGFVRIYVFVQNLFEKSVLGYLSNTLYLCIFII
jgi:hypothetical protein